MIYVEKRKLNILHLNAVLSSATSARFCHCR